MDTLNFLVTLTLGITSGCLLLFYRKRKRQLCVFREMSVPGPHEQSHWLLGNVILPRDPFQMHHKWTQQYGKIYGYYEGPVGHLVVSDLDFLQQVLIKQFSNFHGRPQFPIQADPETDEHIHLFTANGYRWRRMRTIINPTFSASKLRQVSELINEKVKIMLTKMGDIADKKDDSADIHGIYQYMTLDAICGAAFGLETNVQHNPDDRYRKEADAVIENLSQTPFLFKFAAVFPETKHKLYSILKRTLLKLIHIPELWFVDRFEEVVHARRNQKTNRQDLMQLMLNASLDSDGNEKVPDMKVDNDGVFSSTKKFDKVLSNEEVRDNCFLFFFAGYETTSTVLAYLSYLLALNPEKQDKLIHEIDEYTANEADITYDLVMKMPYLDFCIRETLRLYPVGATAVTRMCMDPCTINGLHIPKGVLVHADVWSIHHDPDIWGPDSLEFNPERFSPENKVNMHPLQDLGFGAGPRNCIGMRFGLMEAKLTAVQMLQKFRFEKNEHTEVPLELTESGAILPKNKIHLTILHRSK